MTQAVKKINLQSTLYFDCAYTRVRGHLCMVKCNFDRILQAAVSFLEKRLLVAKHDRADSSQSGLAIVDFCLNVRSVRIKGLLYQRSWSDDTHVPMRTLRIWGSSLIFVFRKNLPMGNTRGSFGMVMDRVPIFGLFLTIVTNLKIPKFLFLRQSFAACRRFLVPR